MCDTGFCEPQPAAKCWRSECRNGCYYPDVCGEPTSVTSPELGKP